MPLASANTVNTTGETMTPKFISNLAEAVSQIDKLKQALKDLKEKETVAPRKHLQSTATIGRGICCCASLFEDLDYLAQEYDRREQAESDDDNEDVETELLRSRDRTYGAFQETCRIVPKFKDQMLLTTDIFHDYCTMLLRGANEAHGDNLMSIKRAIATWLNKLYGCTLDDNKFLRGLGDDNCGLLLCSIFHDWNNLEVRAKLRACAEGYNPSSTVFAQCFYKGNKGDPMDVEKGFLQSSLMLKTYSCIFTSFSSASKVPDDNDSDSAAPSNQNTPNGKARSSRKATRSNIAQKLSLEAVTPCTIAYSAVMLHFSLSDATLWKKVHNSFDYEVLYNFIIDFFEDAPGPAAKKRANELLAWWTGKIFPTQALSKATAHDSMNTLREQQARREAGAGAAVAV